MNERERIIELVKTGVLTTEEGLDLIESLAHKEDKQIAAKEFSEDSSQKAKAAAEDIEDLASDITQRSAEVDSLDLQIKALEEEINQFENELDQTVDSLDDSNLKAIEQDIEDLKMEKQLIKEMVEIDNTDELKVIDQEIKDKQNKLDNLKETSSDANLKLEDLTMLITEKSLKLDDLIDQRDMLLEEVNGSKSDSFSQTIEDLKKQLQFSDEFMESASESFNRAGDQVNQAGKEFNRLFKEMVDTSKSVFKNFEWKKHEFKVPSLVQESFTKTWSVENFQPTILDFKNANGEVKVLASETDEIQIEAQVTMYGKLDEKVEEAFDKRSIYKVDQDRLILHIPNKRIKADLTIKLPQVTYDYVSFNLLNGDLNLSDLAVNDIIIKTVNGKIKGQNLKATMAEIKGSNTHIDLLDLNIQDLMASTVSGHIVVSGDVLSASVQTTNGDIRATLLDKEMAHFEGTSVNGDVKIAVPKSRDLEAEGKTSLGKVYSRLSNVEEETIKKHNEVRFNRGGEGNPIRLKARTASGNVLLKDSI